MYKLAEFIASLSTGILLIIAGIGKETIIKWFKSILTLSWNRKIESIPPEHSAKERRINDLCVELRVKMGSDRAHLWKFHNGEYFTAADPMWKITCTHESCAPGITYTIQDTRSVIVSSLIDLIDPALGGSFEEGSVCVFKDLLDIDGNHLCGKSDKECKAISSKGCPVKPPVLYDIATMNETSTKAFVVEHGVRHMMLAQIINNGHIVGLIGVDYCRELDKSELDLVNKNFNVIMDYANQISYLVRNERQP